MIELFNGISFPFRINAKGGVEMSHVDANTLQHIEESIQQILLTKPRERKMEYHFKSDLDTSIYEPNDSSARSLIEYQIRQALTELEDRITVTSVTVTSKDSSIYATIQYKVNAYIDAQFTYTAKVGEINQ